MKPRIPGEFFGRIQQESGMSPLPFIEMVGHQDTGVGREGALP